MHKNVSIKEMVNNILTLLGVSENNFTQGTHQQYRRIYRIILLQLEYRDIQIYNKASIEAVFDDFCKQENISPTRKKLIFSALNKLDYYHIFNSLQPKNYSRSRIKCLDLQFDKIISSYLEYCKHFIYIKTNTSKYKRVYDVNFMNYLTSEKITLNEIKSQTILDYIAYVNKKNKWKESTKNANLYELRQFLVYLIKGHGVNHNSITPLQVIFGCHKVYLPSYYEPFEVMKLLDNIEVVSVKGKRDYLICLLVAQLGMRAGDVLSLTFSDIHWDKETIEIVQQKTGIPLVLPLLPNLKFALLDYWKNARPKCSSSNTILLTISKPHRSLSNVFMAGIIKERLQKSDIDISNRKHGCHSMRHSLARNLLTDNEALSTITGILGHLNSNTTRKYLGIDTKNLRKISLEVPYGQK